MYLYLYVCVCAVVPLRTRTSDGDGTSPGDHKQPSTNCDQPDRDRDPGTLLYHVVGSMKLNSEDAMMEPGTGDTERYRKGKSQRERERPNIEHHTAASREGSENRSRNP
uniref:Putative secreted protein n=1 Tax=Anopheles marajoara TaxID=58244 RepID=A0A2M4C8L6_9DIPT